jgi:hypothetical protein
MLKAHAVFECRLERGALGDIDQHVCHVRGRPALSVVVNQVLDSNMKHREVEMLTSLWAGDLRIALDRDRAGGSVLGGQSVQLIEPPDGCGIASQRQGKPFDEPRVDGPAFTTRNQPLNDMDQFMFHHWR